MSADSDPPGDTIVVGGTYETDDESVSDDDGLDIYSEDDNAQKTVNEPAAADAPAEPTGAIDEYAKSFDSPVAEGDDDAASAREAEPTVPGPVPESSSVEQPGLADSVLDEPNPAPSPSPSPLASSDSRELSSPSLSVSEPVEPPVAAEPEAAVTPAEPVDDAGTLEEPQQPQLDPQPAVSHDAAKAPEPLYDGSSFAGNDVNLAFEIQELVNDIRAASPAASAKSPSSDSSSQMQLDAESPPAVSVVPAAEADSHDPTISGLAPSAAASLPLELPSKAGGEELARTANPGSLPVLPNRIPPAAPAASTQPAQPGKKGANKGGRGTKNGTQPPSGPAANREPPSGPKGHPGSRHNARNAGQQTYEMFLADERRYTAEAKWEKFPDGSRIFVGNLSQERVSKKEVFNLFHKFGRLAQISLKPAYGFVQYHTATEAAEAIKYLQGTDVRGRKINLEVSKTQKKGGGKDREHSPERTNDRNSKRAGRKGDSYDGRDGAREASRVTDGYRPSYDSTPGRRSDRFGDEHGRGRHGDRGRSRSRSPRPYSRSDDYRQRSPPRGHGEGRMYGTDGARAAQVPQGGTPDAQILLLQDVHKDFVQYVQRGFSDRGVQTDVMFVDPRFLESIVQRQIVNGAHAVIKLDLHAQSVGKVALQTFNRTPGTMQVGFDEYVDLDVNVAAELVIQTKRRNQLPIHHHHHQQPPPQPTAYSLPHTMAGYPQPYAAPSYPGFAMNPTASAPVVPGAIGQVDPALLQKVLMSLQGQQPQASAAPPMTYGAPAQAPIPGSAAAPSVAHPGIPGPTPQQIDINAILSNLKGASAATIAGPTPASYGVAGYPAATASAPPISPTVPPVIGHGHPGADPNTQVQSIMAQLSRFRQ